MEIQRIKEKNSLHTFKDSIQNIDGLTRTGVLYVKEIFFLANNNSKGLKSSIGF